MYDGMLLGTNYKLAKTSKKEVTLKEVEEWWKSSTRHSKRVNLIEKQLQIVEAYYRIKQEI